MYLKKLTVQKFKSLDSIEIEFKNGYNVIFGENGTGKTNIVNAILKIFGASYPGPKSFNKEDYYLMDENVPIIIDFIFDEDGREHQFRWDLDNRNKRRLIYGFNDYVNDDRRQAFCPLHIPPNRYIQELPASSKWTPIGRIMFELSNDLSQDVTIMNKYKLKMQESIEVLEESTEFKNFREGLQNFTKEQMGTRGDTINIKLDLIDPKHILKTLQIFEEIQGKRYNIGLAGQGIQSAVTIAALRSFSHVKGGSLFMIADEPEAYLHPTAQTSLRKVFEEISDNGTQIIVTTHSPNFISHKNLDGLNRVWMETGKTQIKPLKFSELQQMKLNRGITVTVDVIKAKLSRIISASIKEGLFGHIVIIVEGETEYLSFPIWGEIKGIDLDKLGIVIVQSRAKPSLIDICEFYKSLDLPIYLVFDTDSDKDANQHIPLNRNLLNFIGATVEDFPSTIFGANYAALSPNFEEVLRNSDPNYATCENLVNSELNLRPRYNKGIRAKYVAHKYQELGYSIPLPIDELLDAIVNFANNLP